MSQKLKEELSELGSNLESPPSSKESLLNLFKHAATLLSEVDQSPSASVLESMQPFLKAIVKPKLLKHQDKDVKLLVASCLCEITRITAPEAPYSDEILKDIFGLIVGSFSGLNDSSGPSFGRRVIILETVARYRSCIVMLDLECDDLVTEMFRTFVAVVRDDHPENVINSMKSIMTLLVEESDDGVHEDILFTLLSSLGRNQKDITEAARNLSMSVIKHCTVKLEPAVKQLLISLMSGDNGSSEYHIDYNEVIFDLYRSSPEILSGVVPYLTGELLADQSETRLRAVGLVGELFAIPGHEISKAFQPIFTEFLKRLADRVVEVRMTVMDYIKSCLLSYPSRPEAPQAFAALHDRLLDYDENVRKQVVSVVCDVASHALDSVPVESVKLVAERLRDKSLLVKKHTLERLAEIYRLDCLRGTKGCANEYDWIPGKILRCFYDKDFRSDTVEYVLCETMFPAEYTVKHRMRQWIKILPGLDNVEVKALEKILEQKQRLQLEMQKYLAYKKMYKDSDVPESQKGMLFFRVLSRYFIDPEKAEESFQVLDQLKDANIWKILSNILDPDTRSGQARSSRDEILKILGEKHRLFDFFSTLAVKCSYILFNKEHVKEILSEIVAQKSAQSSQDVLSCMNMLVILARYSAMLFAGSEDELLSLLKEDDEVIKEGILRVLAMTGGTIREGLASSSISVDLILERLCLEGNRRQAKYAVHALAAITKDDGLLSLSVLYKKLVEMLKEKPHLASVLQSLGCIAQASVVIYETRESEIIELIKNNILQSSNKKDKKKARWQDRSETCLLKIYGIKTLVKSYLPIKNAHDRGGFDSIIDILRNILSFGEISQDIKSSSVDKAHLKLASAKAVLRLSRHWEHKIPAGVFHLTVRTIESSFPQARKLFRSKLHQYVKDRVLDAKYASTFLFSISGPKKEFEECKRDLAEIILMCRQLRARQLSMQSDANVPMPYPEFILPYLIHSLAHHPLFPSVEESKDVKPFETIYKILFLFLSLVVYGDEDIKPEVKITEKEKETICTLTSILRHIKRSLDVLDATISKNSYALCDLGLLIIKRLAKQPDLPIDSSAPVTLPSIMYKPKEEDNGAEVGETTWLADDFVSAHFESLELEANGAGPPVIAEDEIVQDDEIDVKMPLGKLIKRIKSQRVKSRKEPNDSSSAKAKNKDQGVDASKVVQESNLDGLGISDKFESSNGHGDLSEVEANDHNEKEMKKRKGSIDDTSDPSKISSPKRTKGRLRLLLNDEPSDSELLVSFTRKKRKVPVPCRDSDEITGASDAKVVDDPETDIKGGNTGKSSSRSTNKRKRRSVAGLSKNLSMDNGIHTTDLVDRRIHIWWPKDKTFYEGVVKSYDPETKKHVVLYGDGDVEVLRLDKERWELIPDAVKLTKKPKPSKSPRKRGSASQKNKASNDSGLKKSDERVALKSITTEKKDVKLKGKGVSKKISVLLSEEAENRSDSSDPETPVVSEVDALNSGELGMEKADNEVESPPPKENTSESGGEDLEGEDEKENDGGSKEDEDMKPSIESDQEEGMMVNAQEFTLSSDFENSSSEEEKQVENTREPDQEETESLLQPDEAMEVNKAQPSETADTDDEPIGNWKQRLGKLSKCKRNERKSR